MMYRRSRRWRTEKRARETARFLERKEGRASEGGSRSSARGAGEEEKNKPIPLPLSAVPHRAASSRPRPTSAPSPSSVARQASMPAPATSARSTRRREPARAAASPAGVGAGGVDICGVRGWAMPGRGAPRWVGMPPFRLGELWCVAAVECGGENRAWQVAAGAPIHRSIRARARALTPLFLGVRGGRPPFFSCGHTGEHRHAPTTATQLTDNKTVTHTHTRTLSP